MKTKFFSAAKHVNVGIFSVFIVAAAVALLINSCKKENEKVTEAVAQKKIKIKEQPELIKKEVVVDDRRTIYLTFDDGPNQGTENLIRIVNKHQIPVTTFLVGQHVSASQKQKNEFKVLESDSLFEIANHSFSHAGNKYEKFYETAENVIDDFNRAKDSLKVKNAIARTPGRNIWRINGVNSTDIKKSKKTADELAKSYKLFGWDLEWKPDAQMKLQGNGTSMAKKVYSIFANNLENTSKHLVFLTHDQYLKDNNSAQELDDFINELKKSGKFQFKKISEYPKINEILQ